MDKRKIIISALVVALIILVIFVLMLFLDKDEKKVYYDSEWIISEGEPKESTTAVRVISTMIKQQIICIN